MRNNDALRLSSLIAISLGLACSFEASFSVSFKLSLNTRVLSPTANEHAEVAPDSVAIPSDDLVS